MDAAVALASLEKAGTEQNRKVYRRHGAPEPMFGVSFATLRGLAKEIGVDHDLALALWASGNTDARTLAAMIADPVRIDRATAAAWIAESQYHVVIDEVAGVVARSSHAMGCMAEWIASDDEWLGRAGWSIMAALSQDAGVPDASFTPYIAVIERKIRDAKNRTREAMNRALIAVGGRSGELAASAIAAARRIGPVEVNHGDTACMTPDAELYIKKTRAYAKEKAARGGAAARAKVAGRAVVKGRPAAQRTAAKHARNGARPAKPARATAKRTRRAKPAKRR
jgi:3-methyladenine DNA glycosylase AlkD